MLRTRQRLSLLSGRVSAITTRSPMPQRLCSSCALYFARRLTYFLYCGCLTKRCTTTTTVLSILLLTTTSSRTFTLPRSTIVLPTLSARSLALTGLDARDIAPRLNHRRRALQLVGAAPQAKAEQGLAQLALLHFQLLIAQVAQLLSWHGRLLLLRGARSGSRSTACAPPDAWPPWPPRRSRLPSRR